MFEYVDLSIDQIDLIGPLWEQLCAHHAGISPHFSSHFQNRKWPQRRVDFLNSHARGKMKIELVRVTADDFAIAYCVSNIACNGAGEVDSLFVREEFRGKGVGSELVRRALAWLKSEGASSILIEVAYGNNQALPFYDKFGFYPRRIHLFQKPDAI